MFPGDFARLTPDKDAVVMDDGRRISYAELDERSMRLAQLLHSRGLRPGDTFAVLLENTPIYYDVYWAALRSGLYLTSINRYSKKDEVAHILADSESKALVTSPPYLEVAAAAVAEVPEVTVKLVVADQPTAGFEPFEAALAASPAEPIEGEPRGDVMQYSSGTTGQPKGIRRPLTGLAVGADGVRTAAGFCRRPLGMDENSIYLMPAPLYHAAGLQWSTALHEIGGTTVVMQKFDAEQFLQLIERERVTHTQVVPTMMIRLLDLPAEVRTKYDLSSLQRMTTSAAPCPPQVKRDMVEWLGPIVDEYYAGTESNGLTYITARESLERPGSVGRALTGIIHICDEEGNEVPAGQAGTLYFEREGQVFSYHRDEAKTRAAHHPDHPTWSTLGDMGYVDEDGYLYLTDRRSFTIISGGVNIYPAEIENCLITHPAVADVAVFGLPDPEMGQFVQAVVQPAAGAEPSPELVEELREYVRANLAAFKVPREIAFRAELPRMPTGKLRKGPLRDEFLAARG